ncbi:phosphoenolpyruvate--protein phosphotransferase [candidate division KSB1 bacterium]
MKNSKNRNKPASEFIIEGQPVSPGIAIGKAFILADDYIKTQEVSITDDKIQYEVTRFENAIRDTVNELKLIMDQVGVRVTAQQRSIFDAHMLILEDQHILKETVDKIKKDRINADHAYFSIMQTYQRNLLSSSDSYLRERAIDIRDIKRRVIRKILGAYHKTPGVLKDAVIIAGELNLFDIKSLAKGGVAGVVLQGGGRTSHIAIMIRSLGFPAIFGAKELLKRVRDNDTVVANGITGEVIIHPSKANLKKCDRKRKDFLKYQKEYINVAKHASLTLDNERFTVNANIEFPDEVEFIHTRGKFGVGLYRTEYDFLEAGSIPTEEELFEKYVSIVKKVHPLSVTLRTIDLGGDKIAPFIDMDSEKNPFLGWRAIRICLDLPEMFRKQLRAIIRASAWGKIKLMFPMISTLDEVLRAKAIVEDVMLNLRIQGMEFDQNLEIGIMIEVPSAVILAEQLGKEVDFFSIGTNDLVQYTLAVDRTNAKVAKYYNVYDPSVLRLIRMTVKAAEKNKIPVGMCGEMAGDPLATALLLGLGIKEFSVSPVMLLMIKQILRSLSLAEAEKISRKCLRLHKTDDIVAYLRKEMTGFFPKMDEEYFFRPLDGRC